MPTYSFTRTREQLRDMVLRKLGVWEAGQAVNVEDALPVYEGMDLRLKEMHTLGTLWWKVAALSVPVTLTAGVAAAALPADFLFPVSLRFPQGTDSDEVEIVSHSVFQDIPNKSETGQPRQALFAGQTVYLSPVPQTGGTLQLTYQGIVADTQQGAAPDIPVSMLRCLSVMVAYDLADNFSVPEQKIRRLASEAANAASEIQVLNRQRVSTGTATPEYF